MRPREGRWIILFIGLFVLDRLLKKLALSGAYAEFIPGALEFELFRNAGITFSIPLSGPLVWIASLVILAAVGLMAAKDFRAKRYDRAGAYGLFVFGAFSNLFDRVAYGFTVDYIIFFGRSAVNVADGMIVAGALWLLLSDPSFPRRRETRKK